MSMKLLTLMISFQAGWSPDLAAGAAFFAAGFLEEEAFLGAAGFFSLAGRALEAGAGAEVGAVEGAGAASAADMVDCDGWLWCERGRADRISGGV